MRKINRSLLIAALIAHWTVAEEFTVYDIDDKEILHTVSDKFLSISIDPAVLLAGANLSDESLKLVKHISPAYIRLAGPSTQFVKYLDSEEEAFSFKGKERNLYVTPSMWFGINEWFRLGHLSPVFALNNVNSSKGVWNPNSTLPLMEISDQLNINCHWQLGSDCANKAIVQYVDNAYILKQTLAGFPRHNSWKIVASDLSSCNFDETDSSSLETYLKALDRTVNAITWQSPFIAKEDLGITRAELWTNVPKEKGPVTFTTAIEWAIKVGQAAQLGNSVIFRELRLLELTHETPVYWFSLLHKRLMGSHVLHLKGANQNPNLLVFGHCSRAHNSVKSGAVTLLLVNNGSDTSSANIRLGSYLLDRSLELQSYFLQASNESSLRAVLNNRPLTSSMLERLDDVLQTKLRRVRIRPHLFLEVPPQTVAFFVLTGAKLALCSINEEVVQDQGERLFKVEPRMRNADNLVIQRHLSDGNTLETIKANILKEAEVDKLYYDSIKEPPKIKLDVEKHSFKKEFIKKSKNQHPKSDIKNNDKDASANHLHLTIGEIEKILKERARAKAAARNVQFSSAELDLLVDKATLKIPKYFVSKRDINRALLEEKARFYQTNMLAQSEPKQKSRVKRNINMRLLNMKALQEEHKKYRLDKPQTQKAKRDINLDLVKQRSQSNSRRKLTALPKLKSEKGMERKGASKYSPLKLAAHSSEDLFDDLMQFEDQTFEDLLAGEESFPDLSDSGEDEVKAYFPSRNSAKSTYQNQRLPSMIKHPKKYSPVLKSSAEIPGMDDQWFCDGFKFSEEFDHGFARKKRATSAEAISKDELENSKKRIKMQVKKLKHQLKTYKRSYLKQKLHNKKHLKPKSNIQKLTKTNVVKIIENANSTENAIDHDLQKRSLKDNSVNFGKYKSKISGLKEWKPADIMNLRTNDVPLPFFYSWVSSEKAKQKTSGKDSKGGRQRRYIDDKSRNLQDNLLFDKQEPWKFHNEAGKAYSDSESRYDDVDNEILASKTSSEEPQKISRLEFEQSTREPSFNLIHKDPSDLFVVTTRVPKVESGPTNGSLKSNLTYLERVLGKNKAKPINMIFGSFKSALESVRNFLRNIV